MKYVIFSDIHGNLEAYKSFLAAARKEGKAKYYCVGDIVGYGADPNECVELTIALDPTIVCGNHDWGSVDLTSLEYFNESARQAVIWTKSKLRPANADYLRSLKLTHEDDELTLVHGAIMKPERYGYVYDLQTAQKMLERILTNIAFIGHSHVPGIFTLDNGKVTYTARPKITVEEGKRYLVNVGSVGQPRDGDWRASYYIWDRDANTLELKRIEYDLAGAQKKIKAEGLPGFLATRLGEGR